MNPRRKIIQILLIILIEIKAKTFTPTNLKALMVIEIARHGARSPTSENKLKIPWKGTDFGYDLGELLPSGYRQHYISGLEKTLAYREILQNPLKEDEYSIIATGKSRTIQSAFSHLMGFKSTTFDITKKINYRAGNPLLRPPQPLNFNPEEEFLNMETALPYGFEPPIVHSRHLFDEKLIRFHGFKECKEYYDHMVQIEKNRYKHFEQYKSVKKLKKSLKKFLKGKFKHFFQEKKQKKALKKMSFKLMSKLTDFGLAQSRFFGEKSEEFIYKDKKEILKKMRFINNNKQVSMFTSRGFSRIMTSEFLTHLSSTLFKKTITKSKKSKLKLKEEKHLKNLKYLFYSTHDTFVTPLLVNIGLIDPKCVDRELRKMESEGCHTKPAVASSLVWELLENDKNEFFVRSLYNGEFYDFCGLKEKYDSDLVDEFYSCPINNFGRKVSELSVTNWRKTCVDFNEKKPKKVEKKRGVFDLSQLLFGFICKIGLLYGVLTLLVIYSAFFMSIYMFKILMIENQLQRLYDKIKNEERKETISDEDDDADKLKGE